jgi:hypothetical protein
MIYPELGIKEFIFNLMPSVATYWTIHIFKQISSSCVNYISLLNAFVKVPLLDDGGAGTLAGSSAVI